MELAQPRGPRKSLSLESNREGGVSALHLQAARCLPPALPLDYGAEVGGAAVALHSKQDK